MQMPGRRKMDMVLAAFREIRQNRHLDLMEFAQCILQQLKPICEPSGCSITLIEGGKARTIAQEGMSGHACGIEIRVDTSALGVLRNQQEGLQANDVSNSPLSGLMPAGREVGSALCVPVMQGEVVVGLVYLDSVNEDAFDQEDLCCADLMAEELSLALQRSLIAARVSEISKLDSLVGCLSRTALEQDLKTEIARSKRYEKKFSLFFLEIDSLSGDKDASDVKNDQLLRSYLAKIFRRNLRNIDRIYYYENFQFVVMLPETDKIETITVASRLIEIARQGPAEDFEGIDRDRRTTVSIGISGYPDDGNSNGDLLVAAQDALRQAKTEGVNRLCVHGEGAVPADMAVAE
jgi:diguanylate cyclase (GGDEF)-like protein